MNSIDPSLQLKERHKVWLNTIREVVSDRIINEEDRVPTLTSLWRHWLRSCWVSQMWQHSSQDDISTLLPPPESSGWLLQADGNYIVDWEAHDVQQMIKDNIEFLTKGCSCTKGCRTLRCGCRKNIEIVGQDACAKTVLIRTSVETGLGHPGHPGHVLSGPSGSDPV